LCRSSGWAASAACTTKPDYAAAFNNLGIAYGKKRALDDAIAAFKEAIHLKPDEAGYYSNLGNALRGKGALIEAIASYDLAIATLKNVLAREPRPVQSLNILRKAQWGRVEALIGLGRLNEVEPRYREVLELDPSNHWNWFFDAPLRLQRGDVEGYRRLPLRMGFMRRLLGVEGGRSDSRCSASR
jgi:tetratricopeptide (TPR) repeat protein